VVCEEEGFGDRSFESQFSNRRWRCGAFHNFFVDTIWLASSYSHSRRDNLGRLHTVAWFGVKSHRPEYYGLLPDGAAENVNVEKAAGVAVNVEKDSETAIKAGADYASRAGRGEFTLRQALRTRTFWISFIAQAFQSLTMPIFSVHLIPHLTDLG